MFQDQWAKDEAKARIPRRRNQKQKRSEKPNIVFILTDDQDVELGKLDQMLPVKQNIQFNPFLDPSYQILQYTLPYLII